MTLNQMEQYLTIIKHMNISRAAEELYISHSALSRNLAALERELGCDLIMRDNKVTRLTKAGTLFAERAEYILQSVDTAKADIRKLNAGQAGMLKILCVNLEDLRLSSVFSRYHADYPDVNLDIEDHQFVDVIRVLQNHEADFIVTFSFAVEQDLPPEIHFLNLFRDEFVAVVNHNSPLASLEHFNVTDREYDSPVTLDHAYFDFVSSIGRELHIVPPEQSRENSCNSIHTLFLKIIYGGGWAFLPRITTRRFDNYVGIIPLNINTDYHISLYWNEQYQSLAMDNFLKIVRDTFSHPTESLS